MRHRPFVLSLSKHEWPNPKQLRREWPGSQSLFLASPRKSNQKEGDPGLPPLRGSLDQPQASGAAQLALAGHTNRAPLRSSNSARPNLRLLAADRGGTQGKLEVRKERM